MTVWNRKVAVKRSRSVSGSWPVSERRPLTIAVVARHQTPDEQHGQEGT